MPVKKCNPLCWKNGLWRYLWIEILAIVRGSVRGFCENMKEYSDGNMWDNGNKDSEEIVVESSVVLNENFIINVNVFHEILRMEYWLLNYKQPEHFESILNANLKTIRYFQGDEVGNRHHFHSGNV